MKIISLIILSLIINLHASDNAERAYLHTININLAEGVYRLHLSNGPGHEMTQIYSGESIQNLLIFIKKNDAIKHIHIAKTQEMTYQNFNKYCKDIQEKLRGSCTVTYHQIGVKPPNNLDPSEKNKKQD